MYVCVQYVCSHKVVCFADVLKAQERRTCGLGLNVSTHLCMQSRSFAFPRAVAAVAGFRMCAGQMEQCVNVHICAFMRVSGGGCLFKTVYKCVYVHSKGL